GSPTAPCTFSVPFLISGLFQSIGVSTAPGATPLMRNLRGAISSLKPRVKDSIPPFEDAYGTTFLVVSCACTQLTFTKEPPGCMCGVACLQKRNTERRFTFDTVCKSSSRRSTIGLKVIVAASLTTRPLTVASITKMASPPSFVISHTVSFPRCSLSSAPVTLPPSEAKRFAVARPTPDPVPVTRQALSRNLPAPLSPMQFQCRAAKISAAVRIETLTAAVVPTGTSARGGDHGRTNGNAGVLQWG